MHLPYSAYWVSGIAHHVISHQVSIFLVSFSFFLDKDQNLLFKYIVIVLSCNVVYIAVYFAWSRKKEKFTQTVREYASFGRSDDVMIPLFC